VEFSHWIEVFYKSLPTFKAHALKDESISENERTVGYIPLDMTL
jgi:hypothetical protein